MDSMLEKKNGTQNSYGMYVGRNLDLVRMYFSLNAVCMCAIMRPYCHFVLALITKVDTLFEPLLFSFFFFLFH